MNNFSFEREPIATTPETRQEKPTQTTEKAEKRDTVKNKIKLAIGLLIAFYGAGGPGGTEADKNKEAANLLNEINSQKIVAKANHEKLTRFVLDTFNSIAGGQEASAAEAQAPLERITMDSKQLEENLQRSQWAWELWWKNQPEFKGSQTKEFEAWTNYARLQPGDKVRILWRPDAQGSLSIKSFAIAGESAKGSILLSDFLRTMAEELGDSYNPDKIFNLEIDRHGQKLAGSLGFNPKSPANPLLPDYLKKHLPKGNLEKTDDTQLINFEDINPRSSLSEIPVQPYPYKWGDVGGWVPAEKSPDATIADAILAPSAATPPPKFEPFNPLPSRNTAGIRPAPETKPQITRGGPTPITTINIEKEKQVEPSGKIIEKKPETVTTSPMEKLPTVEIPTPNIAETANAKIPEKVQGILNDSELREKINELTPSNGEKYFTADGVYFIRNENGQIKYSIDNRKTYATLPGEPSISPTVPKNIETAPSDPSSTATVEKKTPVAQPEIPTSSLLPTPEGVSSVIEKELGINEEALKSVGEKAFEELAGKMPSLDKSTKMMVQYQVFLNLPKENQTAKMVSSMEKFFTKDGQKVMNQIADDLKKNFDFPEKSINNISETSKFIEKNLKNADVANRVVFFRLLDNYHKINSLRQKFSN